MCESHSRFRSRFQTSFVSKAKSKDNSSFHVRKKCDASYVHPKQMQCSSQMDSEYRHLRDYCLYKTPARKLATASYLQADFSDQPGAVVDGHPALARGVLKQIKRYACRPEQMYASDCESESPRQLESCKTRFKANVHNHCYIKHSKNHPR